MSKLTRRINQKLTALCCWIDIVPNLLLSRLQIQRDVQADDGDEKVETKTDDKNEAG